MQRALLLALLVVIGAGALPRLAVAQEGTTPTPAEFQYPDSAAPAGVDEIEGEGTPTRTPTPPGPAFAEAIEEANVRTGPGLDFNRLGTIFSGDRYVVVGAHRDFPWYQIEYPDSPTGLAWVYRDLVTLSGNVQNVPILEGEEVPTLDAEAVAVRQTIAVLEQTPGALGTATAMAALLPTGVFQAEGQAAGAPLVRPPTFTPPPPVPTPPPGAFSAQRGQNNPSATGLPPAIPIIGFAALGLMGLFISALRRLL